MWKGILHYMGMGDVIAKTIVSHLLLRLDTLVKDLNISTTAVQPRRVWKEGYQTGLDIRFPPYM